MPQLTGLSWFLMSFQILVFPLFQWVTNKFNLHRRSKPLDMPKDLSDYTSSQLIWSFRLGYGHCRVGVAYISTRWGMVKHSSIPRTEQHLCLLTPGSNLAQTQGISQVVASVSTAVQSLLLEQENEPACLFCCIGIQTICWLLCSFKRHFRSFENEKSPIWKKL